MVAQTACLQYYSAKPIIPHPPTHAHLREIERQSGFAIGTVRQEAKKLGKLELILKWIEGNRTYFRANRNHPLYNILHNLVLQTSGLVDVFKEKVWQF